MLLEARWVDKTHNMPGVLHVRTPNEWGAHGQPFMDASFTKEDSKVTLKVLRARVQKLVSSLVSQDPARSQLKWTFQLRPDATSAHLKTLNADLCQTQWEKSRVAQAKQRKPCGKFLTEEEAAAAPPPAAKKLKLPVGLLPLPAGGNFLGGKAASHQLC